ncbi:hypothetical protein NPIL_154421 [Nephila pilipes]|uniref:Uncharacterized protein n=1 Tax=Nephila pilipes TaxID=299642 RepID=A0A8X6U802_NEPPI|nr:hypothetical protein NPIL_154421 [Nephila pilipes]
MLQLLSNDENETPDMTPRSLIQRTIHELIAPSQFFSTRKELKPRKQQRAFSPQQRRGFNDIKIGINESGCADVLEQATVTTLLTLHWN